MASTKFSSQAFLGLANVKTEVVWFGDRVNAQIDAQQRRTLVRTGAYGRRAMRRSFRKSKKSSPPGTPPNRNKGGIHNLTFFAFDERHKSVVVGPLKLPLAKGVKLSVGSIPQLHNQGGVMRVNRKIKRGRRRGQRVRYIAVYPERPFATEESQAFKSTRDKMPDFAAD